MSLFDEAFDPETNLLPHDGIVNYHGKVLPTNAANNYLDAMLNNIAWKNDEAVIFGKHIVTKRKVAWYGDEPYRYTYSKIDRHALLWTDELLALKQLVEKTSGATFNSCLLNLYHTGEEGMAWHSDDERDLAKKGAIASLTLGAERKFAFKHKKSKQTVAMILEHGSLMVMKGATQTHWLHRLPPTKKISTPRVNLTFRTIIEGQKRS